MPAKINLYLSVGNAEAPDGMHEIYSVFHSVDICDIVQITTDQTAEDWTVGEEEDETPTRIRIDHDAAPSLPKDERNIVFKAANALVKAHGNRRQLVLDTPGTSFRDGPLTEIRINKNIPLAGGMAGGSADAAGTLLLLNSLWGFNFSQEKLAEIGAELGADVPYCLRGKTAIGTGTGTDLISFYKNPQLYWVVVPIPIELLARDVYRRLDYIRFTEMRIASEFEEFDEPGPYGETYPFNENEYLSESSFQNLDPCVQECPALLAALSSENVRAIGKAMRNDLEVAATSLDPLISRCITELEILGVVRAMVSGSGPTVIGLARDYKHCLEIQDRFSSNPANRAFETIWATVSKNSGPRWL